MNSGAIARIRRDARAARRLLPPGQRAQLSRTLVGHLKRDALLWPARRVAAFWPNNGEVDLAALFTEFRQRDIQLLLPVIDGPRLWFAPFRAGTPTRINRFGIVEPALKRGAACPLLAIDIVLMPLVAFDDCGHRIGMGGGFYDRTFAGLRHFTHLRGPKRIGTAFAFQRYPRLSAQSWDIPLHGVVTEQGLQWF